MNPFFFSELLPELVSRAGRAVTSRLGFANPPLRRYLMQAFESELGRAGCFVGDPVFEATFGWQVADNSLQQLSGQLLHPDLVDALDTPPSNLGDYRFPKTSRPYTHQLASWEALLAASPKSVVVTSGTGSGKTECFMLPILSRLAAERERRGQVVGVRALFLYPLNALIQSQRERLSAWTAGFGGDIRFCLYNGNTPEQIPAGTARIMPNEVQDRMTLRSSPPPILVTNPTMLEYMLVRSQDAPILEQSRGRLEWIVLDEAHNYIGSQAAELALLLRRVLHAFGVRASEVRFVATSATIGDGDGAEQKLRDYLAQLAGIDPEQVVVIKGHRHVPALPALPQVSDRRTLPQLEEISDPVQLYDQLAAHPTARRVRDMFVDSHEGSPSQALSAIRARLAPEGGTIATEGDALRWLDLMTRARSNRGMPLLPLRVHVFHDVLHGLWGCVDPQCTAKRGTLLDQPEWLFGKVFMREREHCDCGSPVYPLVSCDECATVFLRADEAIRDGSGYLLPPKREDVDEFAIDIESGEESDEVVPQSQPRSVRAPVLVTPGPVKDAEQRLLAKTDRQLDAAGDDHVNASLYQLLMTDDVVEPACPCCGVKARSDRLFRSPLIGAPFLLGEIIPTLLEFAPDGDDPLNHPMRGRRMITFTDSRQGTARLAARLQQEAERNAVRSAVYQRLATAPSCSDEDLAHLEEKLARKRRVLLRAKEDDDLDAVDDYEREIQELELKKADAARRASFSFADMARWLADTNANVGKWIHDHYAKLDPVFGATAGKELLAKVLLAREFARRPKRVNSLETMGLVSVSYPKLEKVKRVPDAAARLGIGLEEWKAFLKTALDFHVRENTFIDLPDSWRKWGGNRIGQKQLLPPDSREQTNSRLKKWPQCAKTGRQSRLVRLLAHALKLDPVSELGRDTIDLLLKAAWDNLVDIGLLQPAQPGRLLSLDDLAFNLIEQGWVCPVTRRVLDTTFRKITPYLPAQGVTEALSECRPYSVPICPLLSRDFPVEEAKIRAVRQWVNDQSAIQEARAEGLWSDLNDRIVEGGGYFRAVEHSAQQPGAKLQEYEKHFRSGRINLMSCSTTMEMGVDIGGISIVAMNNVPPHPANYLQRAGRAGRRSESRSVALTLCKDNPHDQQVFANTRWPFVTPLPTPRIVLSSAVIVQRHVNSLLLSAYLRRAGGQGSLNKLTMEWWMLPRAGASHQERFMAWCDCFDPETETELSAGLAALVKYTILGNGRSPAMLAAQASIAVRVQGDAWLGELDAIDQQLGKFVGSEKERRSDVAFRALDIQRRRLTGEYLLRELASDGVLPGYGFPTDITSFETLNRDTLEQQKVSGGSREDNRYERRELPSRDTVTALREYAPGALVVLDGLVYESAGITLNWHAPASADAAEIQNIRAAWRCGQCGANGTSAKAALLPHCDECGAALDPHTHVFEYLEPAGFAVDIFAPTHNDVSVQTYVPVELPWISGDGDWVPLPNPAQGLFRASAGGSAFHHSSGMHGQGYALCLECGRSAPMGAAEDGDDLPKALRDNHKRLRGAQGGDKVCSGSDKPFAIRRGIRFGRQYTTDVFELLLCDLGGRPLNDAVAAYSIAVALRQAIARSLGVDEGELGCDTKPIRTSAGAVARVVQVFDLRAAGLCSSVADRVVQLLGETRDRLLCYQQCESACPSCLLTFDTRFRVDSLDRHKALEFLSDQWLHSLRLPESEQFFGPGSRAEHQPVAETLTRELNSATAEGLNLYLSGEPAGWDLAASPLRRLVHRLSATTGKSIRLILPPGSVPGLSPEVQVSLRGFAETCAITLAEGVAPSHSGAAYLIATVVYRGKTAKSFATSNRHATLPGPSWGALPDGPLISGPTLAPDVVRTLDPAGLLANAPETRGARRIEVAHEVDGQVNGFGTRLLAKILAELPEKRLPGIAELVAIRYEDRYLRSPMPVALLVEFVAALKSLLIRDDRWGNVKVDVVTCGDDDRSAVTPVASRVYHDWPSAELRNEALIAAFSYCGIPAQIRILRRQETSHARVLTLRFADGAAMKFFLDQGFSYWYADRAKGTMLFPFGAEPSRQGELLADSRFYVRGQEYATHVFFALASI